MYNSDKYLKSGEDPFRPLANCFLFFCRDSAVFIFPTLLADFKDPIQKQTGSPICGDSHIQLIHSVFFYCNLCPVYNRTVIVLRPYLRAD